MAGRTLANETQGQASDKTDAVSSYQLIFDYYGKPTNQVLSRAAINTLIMTNRNYNHIKFRAGWWYHVRVPCVSRRPLKYVSLNIPDELESPATLRYIGFRINAIPVLWARYQSIVKGGYKPYNLWDFVSGCIIRQYPTDAQKWDDEVAWLKIWDGLQLDQNMSNWLAIMFLRQRKSKEADHSCKSCVMWAMEQRWNRLCNMEKYIAGTKVLRL